MRGPSSRRRSRHAGFATAIRRVGLWEASGPLCADLRARRPRAVEAPRSALSLGYLSPDIASMGL
jgi:hypothetical protein